MRWVDIEYSLVSCVFLFPLVWILFAFRAFLSLPLSLFLRHSPSLSLQLSLSLSCRLCLCPLCIYPLTDTTNLRTNLPPPPGLTTPHPPIPLVTPSTPADVAPTCLWLMKSELHRMGVQNLKIPLRGKIKVEAHGGIQTRRVLLYQRELEGLCLQQRMTTQNA